MNIRVAVIGAGSWGTTVAHLAAHNVPTVVWARSPEVAAAINEQHQNSRQGHAQEDQGRGEQVGLVRFR